MCQRHRYVVSYDDDVYVWVYLDQIDRILRYEAYVVDYDDRGVQSTLKFVIEEGVLDNVHEVPMINDLIREYAQATASSYHWRQHASRGSLVTYPSLRFFYNHLSPEQMALLHEYFAAQEASLKRGKKSRWTHALKALGFDVIGSLN